MGGYAFYVWTSFGITAVVMLLTWLAARQRRREALRIARRRVMENTR